MFAARPHSFARQCRPYRQLGLTALETVGVMVLLAGLIGVILGTTQQEIDAVRKQRTADALEHLAGLLSLRMEISDPRQWPYPLIGPGELPDGLSDEPGGQLADYLPAGYFVPQDPWGRAYVLEAIHQHGTVSPTLASAGPTGKLSDVVAESEVFRFVIIPPNEARRPTRSQAASY